MSAATELELESEFSSLESEGELELAGELEQELELAHELVNESELEHEQEAEHEAFFNSLAAMADRRGRSQALAASPWRRRGRRSGVRPAPGRSSKASLARWKVSSKVHMSSSSKPRLRSWRMRLPKWSTRDTQLPKPPTNKRLPSTSCR